VTFNRHAQVDPEKHTVHIVLLRLLLIFFSVLVGYGQIGRNVATVAIRGSVVSTTGAPVKKATLRLDRYVDHDGSANTLRQGNDPEEYLAMSDDQGNFVFEGIPPGEYTLSAECTGYLDRVFGSPRLDSISPSILGIGVGVKVPALRIVMAPVGRIRGKIVDKMDRPLDRQVEVAAFRRTFVRGKRELQLASRARSLNDGSFIIENLSPDRYYVAALPGVPSDSPKSTPIPRTTFFGNVSIAASASPVDLIPGFDFEGADITIQSARGYEISGEVAGMEAAQTGIDLYLRPADENPAAATFIEHMTLKPPGNLFKFTSVPRGVYTITASSAIGRDRFAFGQSSVTVTDADIETTHVSAETNSTLTGRLMNEDNGSEKLRADLYFVFEGGNRFGAQLSPSGTFRISDLRAGRWHLDAFFDSAHYIKSAQLNGEAVVDGYVSLLPGSAAALDITLSSKVSAISGYVHDAKGERLPQAQVILWPKPVSLRARSPSSTILS
jgi:hypothetical protein